MDICRYPSSLYSLSRFPVVVGVVFIINFKKTPMIPKTRKYNGHRVGYNGMFNGNYMPMGGRLTIDMS